jgi:hypothetical protein
MNEAAFFELGWARWLPHNAFFLQMAVVMLHVNDAVGDLDEVEYPPIRDLLDDIGGLDGSAWSSQGYALEIASSKDRVRRLAVVAGMPEIETNRQLLELLRRLGLVRRVTDEVDRARWKPVHPLPLPDERIGMTPEEHAA